MVILYQHETAWDTFCTRFSIKIGMGRKPVLITRHLNVFMVNRLCVETFSMEWTQSIRETISAEGLSNYGELSIIRV